MNGSLLQANLKGIKKKPGTAPPADLSKVVKMTIGASNRVEMIYVNSQANSGAKVYFPQFQNSKTCLIFEIIPCRSSTLSYFWWKCQASMS